MSSVLALIRPNFSNASVINSLEHIDCIGGMDIESRIDVVLKAICDAGLEKIIAVDRQHKHFDMPSDGVLPLYTRIKSGFLIQSRIIPSDAFPFSFGYFEGQLVVTSAIESSSVPALLKNNLSTLVADPQGFETVVKSISDMGMEKYIGLSFRLDESLDAADGNHYLNEKTFSDGSQLVEVCQGTAPPAADNAVITSWTADIDSNNQGRPFMRGCNRYCEWGPIKGHVTIHQY
jgi:hypothetical protein